MTELDPLTKDTCPHCGCKPIDANGHCDKCGGNKSIRPDPKVPKTGGKKK